MNTDELRFPPDKGGLRGVAFLAPSFSKRVGVINIQGFYLNCHRESLKAAWRSRCLLCAGKNLNLPLRGTRT